jgi:hypothetical protein
MTTNTVSKEQGPILAITTILAATANWRESRGRKYVDDVRNQYASKLLMSLANDTSTVTDELVAELSKCHGVEEAAKEAARRVGFSAFPSNIREFVFSVLLHIAKQEKEIARVFPNGAAR